MKDQQVAPRTGPGTRGRFGRSDPTGPTEAGKYYDMGQLAEKLVFIPTQRKEMPKKAQTTAQLHSSHTLVK